MRKLKRAIIRRLLFLIAQGGCLTLSAQAEIKVPYIEKTPDIDGRLDSHLKSLPRQTFNFYSQFDNPETDSIGVRYALAYNDKYLYLYIETEADTISYHKRGYLWGDGYKLLVGEATESESTTEYYELSYSPTKNPEDAWDRQRIASYNGNQKNPPLSGKSKSQELEYDGVSGFESLISWSDIEPYHPAFMKKMAFGLYFAKGKWREDVGYFSNGYSVVHDSGIFNEEILERMYVPLSFQEPVSTSRFSVQSAQRNIIVGDDLQIEISSTHKEKTEPLKVSIANDLNETVFNKSFQNLKQKASLPLPKLSVGVYTIIYETLGYKEKEKLGILPKWDYREIKARIAESTNSFSTGTLNTLHFKAEQITKLKTELSWYESGKEVITLWKEFEKEYRQLIEGIESFRK
ncbi:hypothetical protein ACOKFD_08865 [Flagellimonas sp. S174]|uniref:hypothetical protein n=1 Tax=Flagellimonas sp. S174 TaxID=3410790 RepID=UPI003BF5C22F